MIMKWKHLWIGLIKSMVQFEDLKKAAEYN